MQHLLTLLVVLMLGFSAQAEPKVSAALFSDAVTLEPGRPFMVAVKLKIAPKFHVYWKNPGDSGSPEKVRWHLPEGFSAGPLLYPAPFRIELPGGLVNYGYHDEVWLFTRITPEKGFTGPMQLSADVNWLVCNEDTCVPGSARGLSLTLPMEGSADTSEIERWKKQLPVAGEHAENVKRFMPLADGAEIEWADVPRDIQFFPPDDRHWSIEHISVQTTGSTTRVRYQLRQLKPGRDVPAPEAPILAYTPVAGTRRAIELPAPTQNTQTSNP